MKSVFLVLILIGSALATFAKEWRGLVPLKSSRADVERLLGKPTAQNPDTAYYRLPSELAVIHFQMSGCDQFGFNWNVPVNTVIGIGVIPRGVNRIEPYLTQGNFIPDNYNDRFRHYDDETQGQSIEVYGDIVTLLDYYPAAVDESLRCARVQSCCVDPMPLFDEYQELPLQDERARLDNFLIQLNEHYARGVISVVGPSAKARNQATTKLAVRAKHYLVKKLKLEPERLLIVDGGYRAETVIRLSIYPIGGFGSRIYIFPLLGP